MEVIEPAAVLIIGTCPGFVVVAIATADQTDPSH